MSDIPSRVRYHREESALAMILHSQVLGELNGAWFSQEGAFDPVFSEQVRVHQHGKAKYERTSDLFPRLRVLK